MENTQQQEEIKIEHPLVQNMLTDMAQRSISNLEGSGELQKMFDVAISKCVKSVIEDTITGYNSQFQKDLKEFLKVSLKVDPERFNIAEYQHFASAALDAEFKKAQSDFTQNLIKDSVNKVIGMDEVEDEYTLSEFLSILTCREYISPEDTEYDGDSRHKEVTFYCEDPDKSVFWIHFDPDVTRKKFGSLDNEGKDKYSCAYRFLFKRDEEDKGAARIASICLDVGNIGSGESFALQCKYKGTLITDFDDIDADRNNILNLNISEHYEER